MIDSKATDNYILQQAIEMLKLTLQWASKPMQIYMIKYDIILRMFWLHKKNSRIDWISKELYITVNVYKILKQPEMSLSKHKSWDHEVLLLNDK